MTLEERLAALEGRITVLEDRAAIENLMGRYQYLHTANLNLEIVDGLWSHSEEASIEEGAYGVYAGWQFQSVGDFYAEKYGMEHYQPPMPEGMDGPPHGGPSFPAEPPRKTAGKLVVHTLTTPVIEIAADGKTAKGVWISAGHESGVFGEGELSHIPRVDGSQPDGDGDRILADWVWLKFGVDFVKEDGQWKLLHLHIYDMFRCPFEENWVSFSKRRAAEETAMDSLHRFGMSGTTPRYPTTFHQRYAVDAEPRLEPRPPEPYTTLSETFRY